jgi:hypothetical protein
MSLLAGCGSSSQNLRSDGGAGGTGGTGGTGGAGGATGVDANSSPGIDTGTSMGESDSTTPEAAAVMRAPDPCIAAGNCSPGTWIDVTPTSVNLTTGDCSNYGTKAVQVDPVRAQDVYTEFNCQGIWKSTDYGQTWNGPINTGSNGTLVGDCAAAITIARPSDDLDASTAPVLFESCIRGNGTGFWKSTNGGVDWTSYNVLPDGGMANDNNQQFYSPAVDPYDGNHLLMAGHAVDLTVESTDGGQTWTNVTMAPGMISGNGGTGGINFINTGVASTTRNTWLWIAAGISTTPAGVGTVGTWLTTNGGTTWTNVDENQHTSGSMHSEFYQGPPYTSGVIFMAGGNSALGPGVLRSADFGQTWTHVGQNEQEAIVIGTSTTLYSMYGWASGPGSMIAPLLETAPLPGTGTWISPATPAAMLQGPGQAGVTNDGTQNIVIVANYNAGLWRYVEPSN